MILDFALGSSSASAGVPQQEFVEQQNDFFLK